MTPEEPKSPKNGFESASTFETWPGGLREALTIIRVSLHVGASLYMEELLFSCIRFSLQQGQPLQAEEIKKHAIPGFYCKRFAQSARPGPKNAARLE